MALTKIKGAGINISAAEKLYFDGGGTTYIQESADGVLDFYADNVKMLELLEGGTDYVWVPVDATKFAIGAGKDLNIYTSSDDAIIENITSDKDIIFKGNDGGSTITALTLDISAAGAATFNDKIIATELDISGNMDIDGTSNLDVVDIDGAVDMASTLTLAGNADFNGDLDVDGTTNLDAVDIDGAVQIDATVTIGADDQGYDVIFYGDTASSNMTWDTSADDLILNDATLSIDQDVNAKSIDIDSEATSADVLVINADALQTGSIAKFFSDSDDTGAKYLIEVTNNHTSAVNTKCMRLTQDAAQIAMVIDQNGNGNSIYIDSEATTAHVIDIDAPTATTSKIINIADANNLTTGAIMSLHSNSDDNSSRNLVYIANHHASADNAVGLYIHQDGADASIELAGNGSIKFPGTQGASSDVNSLDDYEEGTFTGTFTATTSAPDSAQTATGYYTKVGNICFITWYINDCNMTGASGQMRVSGLPFTAKSGIEVQLGSIMSHSLGMDENANQCFQISGGYTAMEAYESKDGAWGDWQVTAASGKYLRISGTYLTT